MISTDSKLETQSINVTAPSTYYTHARQEVVALVPVSARRILDVGCGAGGLSAAIKARQTAETHGVEIMPEAASRARMHVDKIWNSGIEAAIPELPDNYYDCIVVADVLEHLVDPLSVLSGLKQKLVANGKLIASIPNIQNWDVLSQLLEGKWDYRSDGILDRTHLRFFTRKSVQELFWGAGFTVSRLTTTQHGTLPPAPLLKAIARAGLSERALAVDGGTFQFLIEAELPDLSSKPKVTVVILNWNGKSDTLECLNSIEKLDYSNMEIVVVDNGSTDDSVDAIKNAYPKAVILETGANLGYAGGNNAGIKHALDNLSDYILLLNNDTVVSPDLLTSFISTQGALPVNSILGAKIFFYENPDTLWFAGGRWREDRGAFEHIGYEKKDSADFGKVNEIDYATGCAIFAPATVFREIGLLDDRFFLTYEETDWCYRARRHGFHTFFAPTAMVWHKVSASFGGAESPLVTYFMTRNKLLWSEQHLPRRTAITIHIKEYRKMILTIFPEFRLFDGNNFLPKRILWSISSWLRNLHRNYTNPTNLAAMIGIRDYLFRSFGDCPISVRLLRKSTRHE